MSCSPFEVGGNIPSPSGNGGSCIAGHEAGDIAGVIVVAGPDRDVQVFALGVGGGAGQGHPVFPAVESADGEGTGTPD